MGMYRRTVRIPLYTKNRLPRPTRRRVPSKLGETRAAPGSSRRRPPWIEAAWVPNALHCKQTGTRLCAGQPGVFGHEWIGDSKLGKANHCNRVSS